MKTEEIFKYVQKQYGTVPEYLWSKSPDSAVLRHKNGKWYAVIMTVEKSKLGLEGKNPVDIMDVKCDPDMTNMIIQTHGFLPGYHMSRQKGKQMKKAIIYASVHHGNTEKLVKSIAEECQVDLIDAVKQPDADLSSYDMIGFASGIYFSKFHQSLLGFAEKNLPDDKKVFLICTYGGSANYKSIEQILDKKRSKVIGKFGCKGYDTFGPFKLVGGIAKGHPDEEDIKNAVEFVKGL